MIRVNLVRPGPDGLRWLGERRAELKTEDALRRVSVVVPDYPAGRFAGRTLAREGGLANVRFERLVDIAVAVLGGPATSGNCSVRARSSERSAWRSSPPRGTATIR